MTVIIALEHPETGEKAIATDGRCSSGTRIVSESSRKIVRAGEAYVGLSGNHLLQSVVAEHLPAHEFSGGQALALAMRKWLADAGMWKWEESDGSTATIDFNGVIVAPGGVWHVGCDFSAVRVEPGRPAVGGCGGTEAAGAAVAIIRASPRWTPDEVCREAVAVACALDAGCGGEVYVETLARKAAARAA